MSDADPPPESSAPYEATGFWRLAPAAATHGPRLIDPDGHPVFLLGVNTAMRDIRRDGVTHCAGIADYIRRADPTTTARSEWQRLSRVYGFNSVGAFTETNDSDDSGDSYMIRPLDEGGAGAPYAVVVNVSAQGDDRALKSDDGTVLESGFSKLRVGDPFNPAFLADLDAVARNHVAARRDDPHLQMWFAGNETGIFDVAGHGDGGVRDLRRWLWSDVPAGSTIDDPLCVPHTLAAFLRDIYDGSIEALDAAWSATYASFAAIVETGPHPVPYEHDCNDRALEDLQRFVHDRLLPAWVSAVTRRIRAADPNHLVASPRLAIANEKAYRFWAGASEPEPDHWAEPPLALVGDDTELVRHCPYDVLRRDGDDGFDLVAVNVYSGAPTFPDPWFTAGLAKLAERSGLALLISEFGIRARIKGWSNRRGAQSFVPSVSPDEDQLERGRRYASQLGQFAAQPAVVGAAWHAWSDRFSPTDTTAQINMGIVQCTDPAHAMQAGAPWASLAASVAASNRAIAPRAGAPPAP